MDKLIIYTQNDINNMIVYRDGENKIGEKVDIYQPETAFSLEGLLTSNSKFVLLGIPEDIGVRANHGLAGAASAWAPFIKAFTNIQSNHFLTGDEILILGHLQIDEPEDQSIKGLRNKVAKIDDLVYPIIEQIVVAGKIPIVIGGGHNNAYPIIKGTALAKNKAIDVINIDAHADLRTLEGRHSGNGFSYALAEEYLAYYAMFGLHQNYNNANILNQLDQNENLFHIFFDDLLKGINYNDLLDTLNDLPGLEIDLDCIQNVLSSAETPSGFQPNDIRKFILSSNKKYAYLHLCEGAVRMIDGRVDTSTPKLMTYLVSDFIKANV